jgi:hypothetical protein
LFFLVVKISQAKLQEEVQGELDESVLEGMDENGGRNLRRYGDILMEYVSEKRQEKIEGPAVVSNVKLNPETIQEDLDISEQFVGRMLTSLEENFPSVEKGSSTYRFDIDAVPELKSKMEDISDLYPREVEREVVEEIVDLYAPISGSEIRDEFEEMTGYGLNDHQLLNRLKQNESVVALPGVRNGYVLEENYME